MEPHRTRMRQPRLAEMVADTLRQRILEGELPDGGVLPKQDSLLEEFGVSPPSLREALRILETEGLVTVRRGSVGGAVVHAPHSDGAAYMLALVLQAKGTSLEDVALALQQVEPDCVALCALREDRDTAVLPGLRRLCEDMEAALDDSVAFTRSGRSFHEHLVETCGNETLALVAGSLETIWSVHERDWARDAVLTGEFPDRSVRVLGLEAHKRITEAIAAGDPGPAETLARKHFGHTSRFALKEEIRVRADLLRGHGQSNSVRS